MSKVGIFGGSFNPIHNGHLAITEIAIKQLSLDKLILVPSKKQPFKNEWELAAFYHRFTMAWLATRHNNNIICDDIESDIPGTTYLITTLRLLRKKYEGEFYFIMGGDSASDFDRWKDPGGIRELANLVVFPRGNNPIPDDMLVLNSCPQFESSTDIRWLITFGDPIDNLVPKPVDRYIKAWGLYQSVPSLLT